MLESGHIRRQPSTPSSDDAEDLQLNISTTDSCDYEVPPKLLPPFMTHPHQPPRPGARRGERGGRNTQQVTADARRILDRFLRIAEEISRHRERRRHYRDRYLDESASGLKDEGLVSETEHQYAIVEEIFHDLLPTPYQPMGSDEDEDSEIKAAQQFVDKFKKLMSTESDYVDCQMLAASIAQRKKEKQDATTEVVLGQKGSALSNISTKPPPAVKRAVKQLTRPVASKSRSKSKGGRSKKIKERKEETEEGEEEVVSSSSSTEDYEVPDVELLNRKKKSGFRLAIERVQQSFRRQSKVKDPGLITPSGSRTSESSKFSKSDVPLPAIPAGHFSDASETWFIDSEDRIVKVGLDFGSRIQERDIQPMDIGFQSLGEEVRQEEKGLRRKSPLPWSRRGIKDDEKVKENGGLFDGLIRQFRKGSAKLRGKNSNRVNHRCHSADNLSIRPLSKNNRKLLEQYRDSDITNLTSTKPSRPREQDPAYDTDISLARRRCPVDLATPRLVRGKNAHQSLRQKLSLEGLMTFRPRGQIEVKVTEEVTVRRHCDVEDGGRLGVQVREEMMDYLDSSRQPDKLDDLLLGGSSKPFSEKSEQEKELLFERIAEQLAAIADRYCCDSAPDSPVLTRAAAAPTAASSLTATSSRQQTSAADSRISTGDSPDDSIQIRAEASYQRQMSQDSDMSSPTLPAAAELVQTTSYGKFEEIVNASVGGGDPTGQTMLQQIARTFRLTQSAVQMAGVQAEVVRQIKDMTLRYFEDRFADWIVGQGGWESMVEDGNTDKDSELD